MAPRTPNARDDFSSRTKIVIARRTNYYCSVCSCATAGPTRNPLEATSIGVAAHITAAASGGPRYDASLAPDQRKSAENGIWCCQNCGKEVDDDDRKYTVEDLRTMRQRAEHLAAERLGIRAQRGPELAHAEQAARSAAGAILGQWQSIYHFNQQQLVCLDLRELPTPDDSTVGTRSWSLEQVVEALSDSRALVLLGRPGAGKTITLLQAAEGLLARSTAPIPVVFSVSGWVASGRDLIQYVTDRLTGLGVEMAAVPLLLKTCRLALMLNGWNEAPAADHARASAQLRDFLLNHPGTPLALTTRQTRPPPAVPGGSLLEVRPLSAPQKATIVRAAALVDADRFLAELESSPLLEEVTDTPLFLAAALKLALAGRPIPSTRSGLLGSFVAELERTDNHAEMLQAAPCYGFHRIYLAAVAQAMTEQARTTLSSAGTLGALAQCSLALVSAHHLGVPAASTTVADDLVRHHALVLIPEAETSYSFVHQQFQEWFAAQWLEQRVHQLGVGAAAADVFEFQRDVLNQPQWREALEFTMERLITVGESALAAQIVRWLMPVDLIAAAELSHIGGATVWSSIGDELGRNLRVWHGLDAGAHRQCALVAMLATGAPDFADVLWPELEEDDQALMRLCRLYEPFRIRSLGSGWEARVTGWPESQQDVFLGELSHSPSRDEIQFAEVRAATGPPSIRIAALELLLEQSAYARIVRIATSLDFGEWPVEFYERIVCRMPRAFVEPLVGDLTEKLRTATELTTRRGILRALQQAGDTSWVAAAQTDMDAALAAWRSLPSSAAEPEDRQSAHWSVGLMAALAAMLQLVAGDWLARWLAENLGQGLLWEQRFIRYVESFPEAVLVPLARTALPHPTAPFRACERVRALAARGSMMVIDGVIDIYLAIPKSRDDYRALRTALRELPVSAVVDPVISKAATISEFEQLKRLVDIFAPESRLDTRLRDALPQPQRDGLRSLCRRVSALIPDEGEGRSLHPSLAVMLGALGHPDDVPLIAKWVATEQTLWETYYDQLSRTNNAEERRRLGHLGTNWWWWYRAALALFQCAAAEQILIDLLNSPHLIGEGAGGLVDFSTVEGSLIALPTESSYPIRALPPTRLVPMDGRVRARADAIVSALEQFEQLSTHSANRHQSLTDTAVALANINDTRAIELLLRLETRQAGWILIESFLTMGRRGTVLPGRRLAVALEPLIAESEGRHHNSGSDPWYAVVRALRILLASDEPVVAVERMRRIPAEQMSSYNVRDLFDLLSTSACVEAGAYLVELSRAMDETAEYFPNLVEALVRSSDHHCHARALEMMLQPSPARPPLAWKALRDAGVDLGGTDATFRGEVLSRLADADGELGEFLARVAGSFESQEAGAALLARADLRPIEPIIQRVLSGVTETKVLVGQGSGYYLVPRDATALKCRLAALLVAGTSNGAVASRLLALVRARRVEYGQPPHEPLHPDIEYLRKLSAPWPFWA